MPLTSPESQRLNNIRTELDRVWSTWESLGGVRVPDTVKRDVADRYLRQNIQQYDLRIQTHRAALVSKFEDVVEHEVAKAALILRENRPTPRAQKPFAHSASLRGNLDLAWFVAERVVPFKRLLAEELRPGHAERLRGIRNPWRILAQAWNSAGDHPGHRTLSQSGLKRRYYLAVQKPDLRGEFLGEFAAHVDCALRRFLGSDVVDAAKREYEQHIAAFTPSLEDREFADALTQRVADIPDRGDAPARADLIALHVLSLLVFRCNRWDRRAAPWEWEPIRYWPFHRGHGWHLGPPAFVQLDTRVAEDLLYWRPIGHSEGIPLEWAREDAPVDPWTLLRRISRTSRR